MIKTTLMVQGTSSDAGKSLIVTGLCRILAREGVKVAPFKPQNMALNSAVTPCGGEIGRAQAVQALAANVPLQVHFNPILLKPNSDTGAQVIVQGKAITDMQAVKYHDYKKVAMTAVLDSHQKLVDQFDTIVVEGAGSPAEINLREGDIANMGFAEAVDCPVILVADIDRGGVFAQIVGTMELISESEQNRVVGFVINKFRGDVALLKPGLDWLEQRTNKPVLGVLPFLPGLNIAAEDAIDTQQKLDQVKIKVVVPVFSRISNHTDFDPLRLHPNIELTFVGPGKPLPAADLIILPGSKNVRRDLVFMHKHNWHNDINRHLRYGGKVLGICGGYQMLGELIDDPQGVEEGIGSSEGLGLLPLKTTLTAAKTLTQTQGTITINGNSTLINGYEIHVGQTDFTKPVQGFVTLDSGHTDGCISEDNAVIGTYQHGLFDNDGVIQLLADWLGISLAPQPSYQQQQNTAIDRLADAMSEHLDINKITSFIK
ncbi:MAG: cobyric acid synthase [Algicola sp.]|nr:cobyric acid synthase [Algicola sp.]